jgi:hypothetical protein
MPLVDFEIKPQHERESPIEPVNGQRRKSMLRQLFSVSAIALVFAACNSKSSLGDGDGNLNGTGGAGGGGTVEPCAGKSCGSECGLANDTLGYCANDGSCNLAYPVCDPGPTCTVDGDCAVDLVCQVCSDGSYACPYAKCDEGQCVAAYDSCGGQTCSTNDDCPVSSAPCQQCPDGSVQCPTSECVNGVCAGGLPGCGGFDPCDGKACGDACSQCPPDDPTCTETSVLKYCDSSGQCGAAYPVCGNACSVNTDCPAIELCKPCADGSCAEITCQNGQCGWECPAPTNPECTVATDCAAIELCNVCANGSCAEIDCVNGQCEFVCQ